VPKAAYRSIAITINTAVELSALRSDIRTWVSSHTTGGRTDHHCDHTEVAHAHTNHSDKTHPGCSSFQAALQRQPPYETHFNSLVLLSTADHIDKLVPADLYSPQHLHGMASPLSLSVMSNTACLIVSGRSHQLFASRIYTTMHGFPRWFFILRCACIVERITIFAS